MKIFISHSSANKNYGNALVELLRSVGIKEDEIIFTSNVAYGIPIGKNIFHWLKSQISDKPYVIYLLSDEYYSSIACLNEMGAAWVIENEHAVIFTPNFKTSDPNFQNGALDPREIGFHINDEDRLLSFIEHLKTNFTISTNSVLINQKIKGFLAQLTSFDEKPHETKEHKQLSTETKRETVSNPIFELIEKSFTPATSTSLNSTPTVQTPAPRHTKSDIYSQLLNDIKTGKLKDEEMLLLHYIIETCRIKLMTGWQEDSEIRNIKEWEDINELKNTLSLGYNSVIRRFEFRKYTDVSAFTGSGNPKEVKLKEEIEQNILDLPQDILDIIRITVEKNKTDELSF